MNKKKEIEFLSNQILTSNMSPSEIAYQFAERKLQKQANNFTRLISLVILSMLAMIVIDRDKIETQQTDLHLKQQALDSARVAYKYEAHFPSYKITDQPIKFITEE